jgi:hypothetical protein
MHLDERFFFAVGLVLCFAAVAFGLDSTITTINGAAPNMAAAGAAAGLAVAGGLSFVAAALFHRRGGS